jgi:hypothetical protein
LSPWQLFSLVTCGPIIQEVFQGIRETPSSDTLRAEFLAIPCLSDPIPASVFLEAADINRMGRQKGYTIRSATDCLIAAIAIRHNAAVWHRDRDFSAIAKFTGLMIYTGTTSR